MKLTSKRIGYKLYEVELDGVRYEVDGQNHEFDSREWQIFEEDKDGSMEWVSTEPTKKVALLELARIHNMNHG